MVCLFSFLIGTVPITSFYFRVKIFFTKISLKKCNSMTLAKPPLHRKHEQRCLTSAEACSIFIHEIDTIAVPNPLKRYRTYSKL